MNEPTPTRNTNVTAATLFNELKKLVEIFEVTPHKTPQETPRETPRERHDDGPIFIQIGGGQTIATTSMKLQTPSELEKANEVNSIDNFNPESNVFFKNPLVDKWTRNPTPNATKSLLNKLNYVDGNKESLSPSVPQLSLEDLTKNGRARIGKNGKGLATLDLQELLYITILIPIYYIIHRAILPNQPLDHLEGINLAVNTASSDRDGSTLEKKKTFARTEVNDESLLGQIYGVTVFITMMFIACNFEQGESEEDGQNLLHDVVNNLAKECETQGIGTFFKMLARTYAVIQAQTGIMKTLLDEDFKKNDKEKKATYASKYTTRITFLANIIQWMQAYASFGSNPTLTYPSKLNESNLSTNLIQYIQAKAGNKPCTNDLVQTTKNLYSEILNNDMRQGVYGFVAKAAKHLFRIKSIGSDTNILSTVMMILLSNLIRAVRGDNQQVLTKEMGPWSNVTFFPNHNTRMTLRAGLYIQHHHDQQEITTLNHISQLQTRSSKVGGYVSLLESMQWLIGGDTNMMVHALTVTSRSSLPLNGRFPVSDQVEGGVVLQDDAKTSATQSTVAITLSDATTVQARSYASALISAYNETSGRFPIGTDDSTLDPLIDRAAEYLEAGLLTVNQAKARSLVHHGDAETKGTDFGEDDFDELENHEGTRHVEDGMIEAKTVVDVGDIGTGETLFNVGDYYEPSGQYSSEHPYMNIVDAIKFGWQFRNGNKHSVPNDVETDEMFDLQYSKYIDMHGPVFMPNQRTDETYLNQVALELQCHITLVNPAIGGCVSIGSDQSKNRLFIKKRYDDDSQFIGYACLVGIGYAEMLAGSAAPLTEEDLDCAGGVGEDVFQLTEFDDQFDKKISKLPSFDRTGGNDSDFSYDSFKSESKMQRGQKLQI